MDAKDLTQRTQELQSTAEDAVRQTASDWRNKAEDLRDQAQEWQRRAMESARQFGTTADQYVRENPWMTVGVVAAVSFIVGYLLSRNRD